MIQYFDNGNTACIDGISFRKDKKTGYFLSSMAIDGRRKRLHSYVWERENGPVPKGYQIHHLDFDKNNNELSNLVLLTAREHQEIHGRNWSESRLKKARENLVECAIPASKKWHSSPEGIEWHRKHAVEINKKMPEHEYTCTFCGKSFKTKKVFQEFSNRFCSNKCKSAYRRESGIDDIVKICKVCGGEYIENKYKKTTCCKSCRDKKHRSPSK